MQSNEPRPNKIPPIRVRICSICDEEFILIKYNVRICKDCYIKQNTAPKGVCLIKL